MPYKISLLAALLCGHAAAQSEPPLAPSDLATDRPGFTEPTNIIDPGALQLENGFSIEWGRDASRQFTGGSPLIRVGISRRFELRLASDGFLSTAERGEQGTVRRRGIADAGIGAKVGILQEARFLPALSILPSLSLPSGDSAFSGRGYDPQVNLSWSKNLPGGFNVGGNAIVAAITEGGKRGLQRAFSVSAAHNLPRGFGAYAEVFNIRPAGAADRPVSVVNGGLTYLLSPNAQVDVEAGWAVAGPGPRLFLAGGLVIRLPRAFTRFLGVR